VSRGVLGIARNCFAFEGAFAMGLGLLGGHLEVVVCDEDDNREGLTGDVVCCDGVDDGGYA